MGSLSTGALWLASLGLVMMTVFTAAQVFVRYVLNDSIIWSEPGVHRVDGMVHLSWCRGRYSRG